jgi:hypothetical protein
MRTRLLLFISIFLVLFSLLGVTESISFSDGTAEIFNPSSNNGAGLSVNGRYKAFNEENVSRLVKTTSSTIINVVITQQKTLAENELPVVVIEDPVTGLPTHPQTSSRKPYLTPTVTPTTVTPSTITSTSLQSGSLTPTKEASVPSESSGSLEAFASEVRSQGMNGLWAEGKFSYRFYSAGWGSVPGSSNTASLATFEGFRAFFIHNYLGGNKLYNVSTGTKVAVIWSDGIQWFTINGIYRIAGTNTGNCGYAEPFSEWNGGGTYSARDVLNMYYNSPFVIQTCLCSGDKAGIIIITGS